MTISADGIYFRDQYHLVYLFLTWEKYAKADIEADHNEIRINDDRYSLNSE